jgi:integrase
MSVEADTNATGTNTPGDAESLTDATPVLLHRQLVPGTDKSALSRFGENRWHVNEGIFDADALAYSFCFTAIPAPFRQLAKHYLWQVINHDAPSSMRRAAVERPSLRTIANMWTPLTLFLKWLHTHGITEMQQVTAELLDDYLIEVGAEDITLERKHRRITEVRRLWIYRSLLPEPMRLREMPPWDGDAARELLGNVKARGENLTPRIGEDTMDTLLWWSLRFVEDFAGDILAAHRDYLFLHFRSPRGRRARGPHGHPAKGENDQKMAAYIDRLRRENGSLPGKFEPDGGLRIDWCHIGKLLDCAFDGRPPHSRAAQLLLTSGLPIADDAYLDTPITAQLDSAPWHDGPIRYSDARLLARHLSTACLVVIAYLSGARPGEVLNLRRGCIEHDVTNELWLMSGVFFKNAVDANGNKLPAGRTRRDPWVVVQPVADAVAALERLHDQDLLFPTSIEPHRQLKNTRRKGQARTAQRCADDLAAFIEWINSVCERRSAAGIPLDRQGRLNISRFRRTLAWFIRRRPRGLVAGSIQYGHVNTRLLQGYAGDYDSGFPDELAFEDFLARLEELAEDDHALRAGERVSGPAADVYRHRVTAANRQFAGHVLTSNRQARDLLANPALQIYQGEAMTCVFDATIAACQLKGSRDDPMATPDIDDCRPGCRNIARTDRDIAQLLAHRDRLAVTVRESLAPPIRHHREQHELQRINTILESHGDHISHGD